MFLLAKLPAFAKDSLCISLVLLVLISLQAEPLDREDEILHIPAGHAVKIDGIAASGEWDDAASLPIVVRPDWLVEVRLKHDDGNVYFLFTGVRHGAERLFPEILIDPQDSRTSAWEPGQWWFHVSQNLCESNGEPNVYRRADVFLCDHEKSGWEGNNPPTSKTNDIEIRISFSKLKMRPRSDNLFGLALGVTNATGDANQKWFLWPPSATVIAPNTWGRAMLVK